MLSWMKFMKAYLLYKANGMNRMTLKKKATIHDGEKSL